MVNKVSQTEFAVFSPVSQALEGM